MTSYAHIISGKTDHINAAPETEDLDIDVLTSDLVNLMKIVFSDIQTAPSLLVRRVSYIRSGPRKGYRNTSPVLSSCRMDF